MPARTSRSAVEDFVRPLRRVAACITETGLVTSGVDTRRGPLVISFLGGRPVRLDAQGVFDRAFFSVRLGYTVVQRPDGLWDAKTTSWMYHLDDSDGHELFAYHWHPAGRSQVIEPHLHLSSRSTLREMARAHFPTGFVTFASVVRLLIEDFGVHPRKADWAHVLDTAADSL